MMDLVQRGICNVLKSCSWCCTTCCLADGLERTVTTYGLERTCDEMLCLGAFYSSLLASSLEEGVLNSSWALLNHCHCSSVTVGIELHALGHHYHHLRLYATLHAYDCTDWSRALEMVVFSLVMTQVLLSHQLGPEEI